MDEWSFHCRVVGCKADASLKEIHLAFKESAKILHPDKHDGSDVAKVKFQELSESHQYLVQNFEKRMASKQSEQSGNHATQNQQSSGHTKTNEPQITMEEFVTNWASEFHSKNFKKNLAASVLGTAAGLAFGALTGISFFHVRKNKYSKEELKQIALKSLYYMFEPGDGEDREIVEGKLALKKFTVGFLDSLDSGLKGQFLVLALEHPKEYHAQIKKLIARAAA